MRKNRFSSILLCLFAMSLLAVTCLREEGTCTLYEHGVCGEYDFGAPVVLTSEDMTIDECREYQDNVQQNYAEYPDCNVTYDWEAY